MRQINRQYFIKTKMFQFKIFHIFFCWSYSIILLIWSIVKLVYELLSTILGCRPLGTSIDSYNFFMKTSFLCFRWWSWFLVLIIFESLSSSSIYTKSDRRLSSYFFCYLAGLPTYLFIPLSSSASYFLSESNAFL